MRRGAISVAVVVLATVLAACGEPSPEVAVAHIRGIVWASGAVEGATVRVIQWNRDGEPLGELGAGTTRADGTFDVVARGGTGTLLVEVSGPGSYVEAFSGARVALDAQVVLRGAVVDATAGRDVEDVVVSPATTLAVAQAVARRAAFPSIGESLQRSYDRLGNHFGAVAIGRTVPADVTAEAAAATTSDVRYGLALAGLSYVGTRIGEAAALSPNASNTLVLTGLLAEDLGSEEALLDGVGPAGPLSLGECAAPETICVLGANTARARLGEGIFAFVGSMRNRTGLEIPDVTLLVESIVNNRDPELFPGDAEVEPADRVPPMVAWEAPTPENDAAVVGTITLRARATDAIGRPRLQIAAPTWLADEDGDLDNEVVTATIDTAARPQDEREIVVRLVAEDPTGNRAEASRRFVIDRGPPFLEFASPVEGAAVRDDVRVDARAIDTSLVSFGLVAPEEVAGSDEDAALERVLATIPIGGYPDGPLSIRVRATDAASQASEASVTVVIDRKPPEVSIATTPVLEEGAWTSSDVAVAVRVTEANPDRLEVSHNGVAAGETMTLSTSERHVIEAVAVDRATRQARRGRCTWTR